MGKWPLDAEDHLDELTTGLYRNVLRAGFEQAVFETNASRARQEAMQPRKVSLPVQRLSVFQGGKDG